MEKIIFYISLSFIIDFIILENSDRLRELLHNPYLREYLLQIDKSPNAWKAMKIAMLEPLFVEFANECLNIVEPDL